MYNNTFHGKEWSFSGRDSNEIVSYSVIKWWADIFIRKLSITLKVMTVNSVNTCIFHNVNTE